MASWGDGWMAPSRVRQHRVLKEEGGGERIKSWNSVREPGLGRRQEAEKGVIFWEQTFCCCCVLVTASSTSSSLGCRVPFVFHLPWDCPWPCRQLNSTSTWTSSKKLLMPSLKGRNGAKPSASLRSWTPGMP